MPISAYVANSTSNNVSVINTSTFTVTATIAVGHGPRGAAVTPDLSTVFVTNFTDNNLSVIQTSTNTVTGTITVGTGPGGICISPDGTKLLVANATSGTISVVSVATHAILGTVTLPPHTRTGSAPYAVCISPDGTTGYAATEITGAGSGSSSYVEVFSLSTFAVTHSVSLGVSNGATSLTSNEGICIAPNGLHVYVTGILSGVQNVISTASNTIVATMTDIIGEPRAICILPNSSAGFWNGSAGEVYVFNPATNTITHTLTLASGDKLTGMAPTSDSSLVYVADTQASGTGAEVWAITTSTLTFVHLTTGQSFANGVGLSYYPVPPPPTPGYPGATFIPKLFIPIKGKVSVDYTQAELIANWNAIEIWSQRWSPLPPVALFFPTKNSSDANAINANWIVMENWSNQINQAKKAPYPTLFIPRKASNAPTDLDIDFLRVQDWANGIAHG